MVVGRVLSVLENSALSSQNKLTWPVLLKMCNWKFLGGVCKRKKQNGSALRINQILPFATEA